MGSTNSRISAKRIQRETGVTYKTAWRTLREIQRLLDDEVPLERPTAKIDDGDASGLAREGESAASLTAEERTTSELTWMGIASD
jgi:hypothetical protein